MHLEFRTFRPPPPIGFGTFLMESEECEASILSGLRHGYRMIDTAEAYANEEAVGSAIVAGPVGYERRR